MVSVSRAIGYVLDNAQVFRNEATVLTSAAPSLSLGGSTPGRAGQRGQRGLILIAIPMTTLSARLVAEARRYLGFITLPGHLTR